MELVLDEIKTSLEHDSEQGHDDEMRAGIANALLQKLALALMFTDGAVNVILKICYVLGLVFQCSNHVCDTVYDEIGDDLVCMLIAVLEKCMDGAFPEMNNKIVVNAVGALCCICRLPSASKYVACQANVFKIFLGIVTEDFSDQAKVNVLDIIGSIIVDEQMRDKAFLNKNENLVDALMFCVDAGTPVVRRQGGLTAASILNQIDIEENKSLEKMIKGLVLLGEQFSDSSRLSACISACLFKVPSIAISLYSELGNVLLDLLKRIATNDISEYTRLCATTVLKRLIIDDATIDKVVIHDSVINAIASIAKFDSEKEVREIAVEALYELSLKLICLSVSQDMTI